METGFSLRDSTVAILGLGMMGGSLAMALRGHCRALTGFDTDPAVREMARQREIVDRVEPDPSDVLRGADVVILAAPVDGILALLDALPGWMPGRCVVLDIGSSKRLIMEAMQRLPERFDTLGGHPLCGKEKHSIENAEAAIYAGAPFLLTPLERTTARAISAAHQIIEAIGAKPVLVEAAEHDRMLASTSHMPYLLSSALALATPAAWGSFAGPGFRSTSRLAGTPSSMMLGVLVTNRAHVLDALHGFQAELGRLEAALAAEDDPQLEALLKEAQAKYGELVP